MTDKWLHRLLVVCVVGLLACAFVAALGAVADASPRDRAVRAVFARALTDTLRVYNDTYTDLHVWRCRATTRRTTCQYTFTTVTDYPNMRLQVGLEAGTVTVTRKRVTVIPYHSQKGMTRVQIHRRPRKDCHGCHGSHGKRGALMPPASLRIRLFVDVTLRPTDIQNIAELSSKQPTVTLTLPDSTLLEGRLMGGTKVET